MKFDPSIPIRYVEGRQKVNHISIELYIICYSGSSQGIQAHIHCQFSIYGLTIFYICIIILQGDSALKVQYHLEDKLRFRKDGPTDKELANMFHTTKHPWFPR